jgi:hypothetical protein
MDDLTERQQQMLAFERQWWKYADARPAAVRDLFSCSVAAYRKELNTLIALPAALAVDPLVVKRLQRRRDASVRGRHPAGRRLG